MNPEPRPWYAVRSVFQLSKSIYEERIILVRASSFEEAHDFAAADAKQYVDDLERVTWTGDTQSFQLFESTVGHGTEVFSMIRDSKLPMEKYVRRFFRTGREHLTEIPTEKMSGSKNKSKARRKGRAKKNRL